MIVTTGEFVLHKYIIFTVNTTSMKWYLYIDFNKRYVPSFFSGVCITQNDPYFIWHFKIIKTFSFHCFFHDLGKQTIQIGTNYAPLSADLSLYTYEAEILKN
jgi:hypothetical protein